VASELRFVPNEEDERRFNKRRSWQSQGEFPDVAYVRSHQLYRVGDIDAGHTTNFFVFGNAAKALQEALFGCNK